MKNIYPGKPIGAVSIRDGYRYVKTPKGWVKYSRLIMSSIIGRPLTNKECVHHISEDSLDDRPENLQLLSFSEHHAVHTKSNLDKTVYTVISLEDLK